MGVRRIQVVSNGFIGGPGYTNFYFKTVVGPAVSDQADAVRDFMGATANRRSPGWTASVQSGVDVYDEVTGVLTGTESAGAAAIVPVNGIGGTKQSQGGVGACIGWTTVGVNRGRRVRGRTFFIPLSDDQMDDNGTLSTACINGLTTAAEALVSGGTGFGIWSRPRAATGGLHVQSPVPKVRDVVAFLSSRRS